MKVAIVHDDLMQWGGAERVLLGISNLFPDAQIYTLLYDRDNSGLSANFGAKRLKTSFLQRIPFAKNLYKALFFLHPLAFEQFDFSDYDLVISQTTRFAKSIITSPRTLHLCYCHTPPRFLWNFSGEKVSNLLMPILSLLRVVDRISAQRVDLFLAGSENAKLRIKKVYQKDAEILIPFIDLEKFQATQSFDGGYFLIIARLNDYKRVDLAVEAFNKLGLPLKVVGNGPELEKLQGMAKENVEFMGGVSGQLLLNLIAGCKALIVTAEEDFGLTPLEAQALGKGVVAYGKGGALETVVEGKTGIFFNQQTAESLANAIERFLKTKFDPQDAITQAGKFSRERFQKRLLELVNQTQSL